MRIALGIEYDGSPFAGWQWQPGKYTLQATVEEALCYVANAPIRVVCAGRTDAGVHAMEQVVHFDTDVYRKPYSWLMGTNTKLPDTVRVTWAREMPDSFHSRYSAVARLYRYVILNRPMKSALRPHQVTWHRTNLHTEWMDQAAQYLIGEHDFSSFRAQDCQSKSPNRFVYFIHVSRKGEEVQVDFCANAFLHHMVRNLVGVLLDIGEGKHPPVWAHEVLQAKNRRSASVTAPPDGLYFMGTYYPDTFGLTPHPLFHFLPHGVVRYTP